MRPALVFAFAPERVAHVFSPAMLAALGDIADVLDADPITDFAQPHVSRLLARAEIMVTGWGCQRIDAAVLGRAPGLRLIGHAAGTVKDHIDEAVYARGIRVTHAAEANAGPVAEFTLAAILFANKAVFRFRRQYCADKNRDVTAQLVRQPIGNIGRTIGIVGASRIGRRVIELLKPFGFHILLFDPYVDIADAAQLGAESTDLATLMARSDIVSLHAPLLPATRHMIGMGELGRMKDGATLINTARGALVDEAALIAELRSGRIEAIIDVTTPEIPATDNPLYDLPNVFLTPHIAGAIGLERSRLGDMILDEIRRFIAGESLRHEVTPQALTVMA